MVFLCMADPTQRMNSDSRIFIAGHRGMVGSAIFRLLSARGYSSLLTASRSELNLIDQRATFEYFEKHRPEYVFLAAARVGGIHANNTYRAEFFYENMMIAANVIEAAHRSGSTKLINLGSSCIYPKLAPQPLVENVLLSGSLESTNEAYAIAKIAAVKMCSYYNHQYGTQFVSLMPTNLYGPNDNYNLDSSHVLPALIRKFVLARYLHEGRLEAVRANIQHESLGFNSEKLHLDNDDDLIQALSQRGIGADQVSLWGSGKVFREFLHADDLADAALYFMNSVTAEQAGEIVNIGTGRDGTIRELADAIASIVGFKGSISYDSSKPDGTPRKLLDVSKAGGLGWSAKINLHDGLSSVIKEYMHH